MASSRAERPPKAGRSIGARGRVGALGTRWPKLTTGRAGGAGRAGAAGAAASGAGGGRAPGPASARRRPGRPAWRPALAAGWAGAAAASLEASARAASAAARAAAASAWAALAAWAVGGGGLFTGGGVAARLFGGGGLGAFGLGLGGQSRWRGDGLPVPRWTGGRRQDATAADAGAEPGGGVAVGARTRDIEALRTLMPGRGADAALGLDHHGLGAAVAEALLHGAGRNRSRLARLQAQRRARSRRGRGPGRGLRCAVVGLVVLVVIRSLLLGAEDSAIVSFKHKKPCVAPLPFQETEPRPPKAKSGSRPTRRLRRNPDHRWAVVLIPLRGTKRSKSRQSFDLDGPAIGPPAFQQDGVYRIFQPKGQTQIVGAEYAADFRVRLMCRGQGQQLAAPVGGAVRRLDRSRRPCRTGSSPAISRSQR